MIQTTMCSISVYASLPPPFEFRAVSFSVLRLMSKLEQDSMELLKMSIPVIMTRIAWLYLHSVSPSVCISVDASLSVDPRAVKSSCFRASSS